MVAVDSSRQKRRRKTKAQLIEDLEKLETRVRGNGGDAAGAAGAPDHHVDQFAPVFTEIFRNVPDAALLVDPERRIVACNPAFSRTFGYRPDNIHGRDLEFLYAGKRCDRQMPLSLETASPAPRPPAEVSYKRANGQSFAGDTMETPVGDGRNGAVGFLVIIRELAGDGAADRESARFRRVIENLGEGLAFYDADDRLIYCNDEYRRIHPAIRDLLVPGARFEDLVRANAAAGIIPEARGREEDYVQDRLARHRNPTVPVVRKMADGTWFIIREGRTPDGGTYAITTDVSQLKHTEAELRENQKRFTDAISALQEGFAIYDDDDRLVVCNDEYRRLHPNVVDILKPGMRFEDLVRLNIARGMNADAIGREEEHIRDRLERHRNPRGTIIRNLTDGTTFMIKESRIPDGGVVVTETDVTERRRTEQALRASEERLRGAIESLQEGFALFDADDRLVALNEKYRRVNPEAHAIMERGGTYEDVLRANIARGVLVEAIGREEDFIRERLIRHRNPKGTIIRRFTDGSWYLIREVRTPEGGTALSFIEITDLLQAEEALKQSEQRFKDFAEVASDWFWEMDENLRFTYFSGRNFEVTGYRDSAIIGKTRGEVTKENTDTEHWQQHFADLKARRPFHDFCYDLQTPDGKSLRISIGGMPIFDASGAFKGYRGTGTDVTERWRAEEALKESESRFRAVVDNLPSALLLKDLDGHYVLANKQFNQWFSADGGDLRGKTTAEVIPGAAADRIAALDRAVIETGTDAKAELDLPFADGSTHTMILHKFPILDREGRCTAVGGVTTDISERKQAEEALKESEARFRNLIEGSIQGILISDQSGALLFANQALLDIFGYRSIDDLLDRENANALAESYETTRLNAMMAARFRGGDVPDNYEFDGLRKDGASIRLQATSRVLSWRGEPAVQTTLIDVTARWQAQRARERLSQAVENVPVGIALFDSDDRLEFCNSSYREMMVIMADKLKRGTSFEDLVRTIVERAPVQDAKGREEEYIQERMERHRNPAGPVDLRRADKWLRANETRMADGSTFVIIADITERKQAEEMLFESEKRLRGAIESLQEGFALFDVDDRLVAINDVYRQIEPDADSFLNRRLTFEEIIRTRLDRGDIVEAIGREEAFVRERMEHHRNPTGPIIRQFRDGNWHIIKETRTADGGTAVTFTDITELKRAEAALKDSEERFRDVAESAGDWFWEMGPDLRFTFLSQRFFELFPMGKEAIIGKTRDEFAGAALGDRHWHRHLREIAAHRPFRDFEYAVGGPDGRPRYIRISGKPVFAANGDFIGYRGTGTDVTVEKQAEAAAARAQAHLFDAVESIDAGIALFDRDDRLVLCNSRYRGLHPAIARLATAGTPFRALIEGVIRAGVYHPSMGTADEMIRQRMHYHLNTPSSHEQQYADGRWLNVQEYSTHDGGRALIWTDITERRMLEKQLAGAQRMEALGKLTGGVAHDFNNLLTIVLGNLQLLEGRVGDDPKLKKYVQMSTSAAQRGAELTGRLLAFARRQMLETALTDVNKLVFGMSGLLHGILGETIRVDFALDESLKAVRTDGTQLENALINLAINARDAMPEGGDLTFETANVTLDRNYALQNPGATTGDFVMIAIADTGVGMTPDVVDHAFEPFFTTKDIGKGTGLGLSMIYGFVKQSGGYIKIYSEIGEGTVVRMYLPCAKSDDEGAEAAANQDEEAVGGPETILVVEDDAEVRQTTVALLEELKYRVIEAVDGPSALKVLDVQPDVDMLLTDVIMPGGMRGPDLAREVRKRRRRMKILYMSGYTEHMALRNGMVEPDVPLLTKPFQKRELAAKVRAVLDT
jgi:PAS domain S-box-containing protein